MGEGQMETPYFATVSYVFRNQFPSEPRKEVFEHMLSKALNS